MQEENEAFCILPGEAGGACGRLNLKTAVETTKDSKDTKWYVRWGNVLPKSKTREMDRVLPDMGQCRLGGQCGGGVGAVRGSGLKVLRLSYLWCRF